MANTTEKVGGQILVIDFTEGRVGGESIIRVICSEFPTVTIKHVNDPTRIRASLRCTQYDLVICVTDYRIMDVQGVVERIRTAQYMNFAGEKIVSTRAMVPIIIYLPNRHILAFASTQHVVCVGMQDDVAVILAAIKFFHLFDQQVARQCDVETSVSASPCETHYRPKTA